MNMMATNHGIPEYRLAGKVHNFDRQRWRNRNICMYFHWTALEEQYGKLGRKGHSVCWPISEVVLE